jgi:hypothetical protein
LTLDFVRLANDRSLRLPIVTGAEIGAASTLEDVSAVERIRAAKKLGGW